MTEPLQPNLSAWYDQPGLKKKELHPGGSTLHLLFLHVPTPLSQRGAQLVNTNPLESAWERRCLSRIHVPGASLLKWLHFRVAHKKGAASFWLSWAENVGRSWNPLPCPARRGFILRRASSPASWVEHVHTWVCRAALSWLILHLSPKFSPRLISSFQPPGFLVWIHLQPSSLNPCLQQGSG